MKPVLGILKIGANITWNGVSRSAANQDIMTLCRALYPNFDLHFITKITRNTLAPNETKISDIMRVKDQINDLHLDAILVFNGQLNSWGGVRSDETIANWQIINEFKGPVFYIHTDCMMRLSQIWPGFEKKGWLDGTWNEQQIQITRDDINYITQGFNHKKVIALLRGTGVEIKPENIHSFDIAKSILLKVPKPRTERTIKWDLIYGGSFRSGRRRDRMCKYFFGHTDLSVLMFGSLALDKFNAGRLSPPVIEGSVSNSSIISKMRTGLATVIIGDDFYANHWTTLRFYEALIAGVIPFVDYIFDRKHRLFDGSPIEDFLYIKTRRELIDRINLVKNEDCLNDIVDLTRKSINWDKDAYIKELQQIIGSRI